MVKKKTRKKLKKAKKAVKKKVRKARPVKKARKIKKKKSVKKKAVKKKSALKKRKVKKTVKKKKKKVTKKKVKRISRAKKKPRKASKARKVKKIVKKATKAKKPTRITKTVKRAARVTRARKAAPIKTPAIGVVRLPDTIKQANLEQSDYIKTSKPTDIEKIVAMISDATKDYAATEATKFDLGIKHDGAARFEQELPKEYGKDRVVLLAVDPNFVFTYWEIKEDSLRSATEHVGPDSKLTLRFYDIGSTLTPEQSNFWDIEVFDRLGNWYLKLSNPEQRLCIDIGMKNSQGRFHRITRSNFIRLPAQSLAKPGPIKWMIVSPEGDKIVSDVEEYTDADLALLKKILGPYFYDLLMRGRLASIAGSSVEAVFYDVDQLRLGASPSGSPPWTGAR